MKLPWWRKGLIALAVLVGVYFALKHVGFYLAKPILEKELSRATKLNIQMGAINYSILGRSFSIRELKIQDHNNMLLHLHRVMVSLKVSLFHPFTVPIILQAEFPQKGYLDFSATYGMRAQTLDGKFQLNHYALVNMKDLFKDRFALVPKDGIVYLNSDFKLLGTKLQSFHHIKIENFNYSSFQGVMGAIGGLTGGMLSALTKKHKGNLAFSFRLDGDLADKKFNWNKVVSAAMSKAFQDALQGSVSSATQPASDLIEDISDILP